jgi:hypothetical protein
MRNNILSSNKIPNENNNSLSLIDDEKAVKVKHNFKCNV